MAGRAGGGRFGAGERDESPFVLEHRSIKLACDQYLV
jgi:hypothetical protein